jgi:hypothetical protein
MERISKNVFVPGAPDRQRKADSTKEARIDCTLFPKVFVFNYE